MGAKAARAPRPYVAPPVARRPAPAKAPAPVAAPGRPAYLPQAPGSTAAAPTGPSAYADQSAYRALLTGQSPPSGPASDYAGVLAATKADAARQAAAKPPETPKAEPDKAQPDEKKGGDAAKDPNAPAAKDGKGGTLVEAEKGPAPKGKAKPGARAAATDEQVPEQVLLPEIDTSVPSLAQSRVQSPDVGEAFRPAALPPFRAPAKAKPGPPNPDQARAAALFRRTMAASARLHASFIAIARHSVASVQATQSSLGGLAQSDLDRGLMTLRGGLDQARLELDRRADAADGFIEMRRMQTYLAINAAANSALGALNALKGDADATFAGHQAARIMKGIEGFGAMAGVVGAGGSAASAVSALDAKDYPTSGEAMDAAINEAIGLRLPDRRELRATTYTEEMTAQAGHLSKIFGGMNTALGKQFTDIGAAMTETAKSSAASIVRSRDAARKQLAKGVRGMHRLVDQARQRGHAALVGQHNSLRREMIASHRDRAARDDMQAQQRAARGTSAALQAAKGQQAGADGLDEALAKEAARPPEDLAKVIQASAGGMLRQMARAGPEQRDRLDRSVRSGEDDARAQSGALGARLARSADGSGEQLNAASRETGQGIEDQARHGAEPLGDIPPQVTAALAAAYPATQAGYLALNEGSAEKPGAAQFILQAQKTIVDTLLGVGGGKGEGQTEGAAPAAAATDAKGPKEKPAEFRDRAAIIAQKPKTERGIDHLLVTAEKEIPSQIDAKAGSLYDSLMATSTNVEAVMAQLRGLTTLQGVALSQVYAEEKGGRNLARDLQSELWKTFSTDYTNRLNVNAALNYLAGNVVEAANLELKAAVHLWNDTGRAEKVQRAMTPAQLDKLNEAHPDTMKDVSGDLDEGEKVIFDTLNTIKPLEGLSEADQATQREANYEAIAKANAHALKRDIDQAMETKGEAGGDKAADAVATAFQSAGGDTLSGGDGALDDPDAAAARREAIWSRTDAKFAEAAAILPNGMPNMAIGENANLGAIARYASAARTYVKLVPNEGPHGGFRYETVQQGLSAKQAQLIDDIAKTGPESEETAASTIEFEMSRSEGKPREDRLRKALLGEDLMAAREGESDAKRAQRLAGKDEYGNVVDKGDEERARERKANVLRKVAERRAKAQETKATPQVAPQSNDQIQKQILAQLDARFVGDPSGAAYTKSMIENDTFAPDPVKAFDFALAHDERNKETLKATTERMTRDEITAAVGKWDEKHPGKSLYSELGLYGKKGKLEGDARNEVEIGFRGKPRNDKEKALIAIMVVEQQERDSAAAGRAMARADFDRATKKRADILETIGITRDQIDEKGDIKLDVDGNEFKGNFNPEGQLELSPQKRRDFESTMRFAHMNAESYKQAVDRISQGIVMALVVAAAIITTFVTFGGAAAIWGPILITAAAGFAGMYATSKIRGDRYTSAEMQRDFVMTLVQAATAGLGAWLGAGAKATGAAAKGVATVEKGVETAAKTAATGEKIVAGAAGMAGKQGVSMGAKALQFGKDVVIGGTTNSINSFAAAAMDPENRRQGTALGKGIDGGVKGFLSGSLGAAVTKPLGALGRGAGNRFSPSLGKAGERIVGNVGSGYVSRLADARIGQAMGDPHQSWAESIEGAKEGIGQDLIQAVGEHHAEGAAGRRAARRTARAVANRPAAEPAAAPHPVAREPANDNAGPAARPAGGGDPGHVTVPAPHAGADFDTGRSPLTDEPGSLRPHPDGDEPLLRMRTAAGDDDAHMRSWDDKTNPEIRIVHPTFPDGVDLQTGMLGRLPDILPDTVIRGTDRTDPKQARQNYELMREHTLGREVLLAHNPKTGEYIVIQGLPHSVAAPPEGFVTLRHSHPELNTTDFHAHFATALPSGVGGDFSVLMQEVNRMAVGRQGEVITHTSAIDIQINGRRSETTFSITKQGDSYTLSVALNPPLHGTSTLGPFKDIRQYAQHASTLAGGGTDFGLSKPDNAPAAYTERGRSGVTDAGEPSRVVRGATLAESERHDAAFVAAKMGVTDAASEKTRKNPVVGAAVEGAPPVAMPVMTEAHDRVRAMGLVGKDDSLAKLTRLLNANDAALTPAQRSAVAQAVLEATRFDMLQKGTLNAGDDVVMLFRGAQQERIDNYQDKGIDVSKAESGSNHDAGKGLYGSQDYESALRYTGSATPGGNGAVLPLIVRRSELGNVIDVRGGTPLGDRWHDFVRASKHKGVVRPGHEHLKGVLYPGVDHPIAVELDGRGDRYDAFLKSLADDPSLPDALRAAARDPHITLMDLGGVASVGNDRTMLTDQWTMHGQRIADLFNDAHGFPKPGREGPAAMPAPGDRMRTAAGPDPDAPAKVGKGPAPEPDPASASVPEPGDGQIVPTQSEPPAAPKPTQAPATQGPPESQKPGERPRPSGLAEQVGALRRLGVDFSGEKNRPAIGRKIAAVVALLPEDHPMRGALADIAKQLQSGRKGPRGRDPWLRLANLIGDDEHGAMIARELDRPAPGSSEEAVARRGDLRREWSVKRARGEETARGVELREAQAKALGEVAPSRDAPSTSRRLREVEATPEYSVMTTDAPMLGKNATGAIDPATGQRIAEAMRGLHNFDEERNFCLAQLRVGDESQLLMAKSNKQPLPGMTTLPRGRHFTPNANAARPNDHHTESVLLEHTAQIVDAGRFARNSDFAVSLYTEREPCGSCRQVIRQFADQYPQIAARSVVSWSEGGGGQATFLEIAARAAQEQP